MTDPIEPTPGITAAPEQTAAPKQEPVIKKLEFTQEELDQKFKERQERGEKAAAKRLEAQYKAQMDELLGKLKTFEEKDLTDVDKLKKEHEKATGKISELDKELAGVRLENAKLKALIKAGAQPDQLDGLLKRVSGSTEEEIVADVEELKTLGWIGGKQPEPKPAPLNQGTGTQVANAPGTGKKTLVEQQQELDRMSRDMKLTSEERLNAAKQSLKIANRLMRGET